MDEVELGYSKKTAAWKLRSKFFPSKIGGKPSWLALDKIPEPSELVCKCCGNQYVFLMQVYANLDDCENAFHRTIYVFMCSNGKCIKRFSNENFVVFRCQLPRKNNFYSYEPPVKKEKSSNSPSAEQYQDICDVCGCKAVIKCEQCSKINYCSDSHKKSDWDWKHKNECNSGKQYNLCNFFFFKLVYPVLTITFNTFFFIIFNLILCRLLGIYILTFWSSWHIPSLAFFGNKWPFLTNLNCTGP